MSDAAEKDRLQPERKLQVVTACRARDLPVLEIAARKLIEHVPLRSLHVIAPAQDCRRIGDALGIQAVVISEDDFIPGMTLSALRKLNRPHFPQAAGWYFQQLLKLQFAFLYPDDDYYLIWDADTVPLRPLRFFDPEGRMLLTRATEHHPPYFETYQRLLQEPPRREYSLIAQHMVVQKSVAREMLAQIHRRTAGNKNWAWSIMDNLPLQGDNLFSEYETYGHYVKNHHPDRVRFVERDWLREGAAYTGGWIPRPQDLQRLGEKYDYVAFERVSKNWLHFAQARLKRFLRPG
jgi:hypothetical protein